MAFCLAVKIVTDGKVTDDGKKITVKKAKNITVYATTNTGFLGYDKMPETDREKVVNRCIAALNAVKTDYDELLSRHIADYKSIFERQTFSIGGNSEISTVELLKTA